MPRQTWTDDLLVLSIDCWGNSLLHTGGHGLIGHPDETNRNRYRGFSYHNEASDSHRGTDTLDGAGNVDSGAGKEDS